MRTWNDYDIAAFDFRDSIAWVADCLDRHVVDFPFIDRWGRWSGFPFRRRGLLLKIRGIEAQQRFTPEFIEDVQRNYLEILGQMNSPDMVLSRLERTISELHAGNVDSTDSLSETAFRSQSRCTCSTRRVAALERARDQGLAVHPGQDVMYVPSTTKSRRESVSPLLTRIQNSMIYRTMRRN